MSTNVLQQSAQWLIEQVGNIDAAAKKQDTNIRAARSRINTLKANAERVTDAKKRVAARASASKLDERQRQIEGTWSAFASKYKSVRNSAVGWMKANGLLKGTGLGVLPLVPVAIAATVLTVWGTVRAIEAWNAPHLKALALEEKSLNALVAGQITPEQFQAVSTANARVADKAKPAGDPLGLTSLADALLPIGLVVIGIMVLPTVLQEFKSRRKAVTA